MWRMPQGSRATFYKLRGKIINDNRHASHYLFCYTSKPNNFTSQHVNNYKKTVMTSTLTAQQREQQ